jgi:hypothetical protein
MPRAPRLYAPGSTMHVVARCNNREFYCTVLKDEVWLAHMQEMSVTRQRAVGSLAFVARYVPRRRGRPRIGIMPSQHQGVRP